jgi:hypothetical protein
MSSREIKSVPFGVRGKRTGIRLQVGGGLSGESHHRIR